MNVINTIFPYKWDGISTNEAGVVIGRVGGGGIWVFDDERVGLDREPFVAGADILLDKATVGIPDAVNGFRLTFSQHEFPEYDECIKWLREESGGNVYWSDRFEMEGWLCPALLRYFEEPPANIYFKAEAKDQQ